MQRKNDITAIVLCGGLGTRLRSVTHKVPKPMVSVGGRPFLEHIFDYLLKQGVNKAILAVSYKKDVIINYFGHQYKNLTLLYSIEPHPLGTGGAIKQAIEQNSNNKSCFLVINGDTFVEYNLQEMYSILTTTNANLVMSIKHTNDTKRFGKVTMQNNKIIAFEEKKSGQSGFINTGVYLFKHDLTDDFPPLTSFSFEKDFLEKEIRQIDFSYSISNGYFIDIGIPKDYYQAQKDLLTTKEIPEVE